jgi:serine/threonine protein kinase
VYRATYDGSFVAVKELLNPEPEDDMDIYYQREMATLKEMRHPNVLKLMGLCKHNNTLFIITEFIEGGDLRRHLKNKELRLSWSLRTRIARDCAAALGYMHGKSILHRDLKSKNLLVAPDWSVKMCDFGFARKIDGPKNSYFTICGTDEWMSPEVMLGERYDEKADVYSFGMVLVEIITREKPIERASASAPYDYEKLKMMTPPSCPYELFKICILCSQFYPINRPTVYEALEMLEALNSALAHGEDVKTVSDIQAEIAAAAAAEQAELEASDDDGDGSHSDADDKDDDSGADSLSEADDERLSLTNKVAQVKI